MMPQDDMLPVTEEDTPQWTSVHGKDLLVGIAIIWGVEILLGVILAIWMGMSTGMSSSLDEHPVAVLVTTLMSAPIILLVCWYFVCRKYGKSMRSGFLIERPNRKSLIVACAIGLVCGLISIGLSAQFSTGQSMFGKMTESVTGLLCVILIALLAPVIEEVYYRGFLFPVLQDKWGSRAAVIIVAIWFAGIHVFQNIDDPVAIPVIAAVSVILTMQRCVTRSLTPSLITHLTYNMTLVVCAVLSVLMTS